MNDGSREGACSRKPDAGQAVAPEVSARIANVSFVAAVLVVLLHVCLVAGVPTTEGFAVVRALMRDFARFSVPFFFLISGYLLAGHLDERGWWRRETGKRLRTLLVPYLAWSLLFGAYLLLGAAVPECLHGHPFDLAAWWADKRWLLFGLDPRQVPLMLPLWYVRTLLVLVLLSGWLAGALRRWGRRTLVVLGTLYLVHAVAKEFRPEIATCDFGAVFRQTLVPEAFFYFTAGLWLRIRGIMPGARKPWPFFGVAIVLLALRQMVGGFLPYPLIIPVALAGVWCAVPAVSWPKAVTALAFPIYLMHWFFVHSLSRQWPETGASPASFLLALIVVLAANIVLAMALRRLAPRVAGVLFGGR